MSIIGTGSTSLRKQDVAQQIQAGVAYRRLVFAHKASAGDSGVNFTSLTQPSEMAALGFTNPSSAEVLAANILFYKNNLTVVSSLRGLLIQNLSYTVPTSSRIAFQGFTASSGEIFTFLLDTGVKDGVNLVDATPVVATGELAIGTTDFNAGTPFEVGKYPGQQIGSVLVFRNGQLQFRNTSNSTSGGNYQEIDNGAGLGTLIRFNNAPVGQTDNIVVWGSYMSRAPDGSMVAAIEKLSGQIDSMVPYLAQVANVPQTTFQATPNSQDLRAFGSLVQTQGDRITALETVQRVKFAAYRAGALVINNSPTIVPFDTVTGTVGSQLYDTATGKWTAQKAAWYGVSFGLRIVCAGAASGVAMSAELKLNGTTSLAVPVIISTGNSNPTYGPSASRLVYLNVGDYLEVYGSGYGGGGLTITGQSNYLTICEAP